MNIPMYIPLFYDECVGVRYKRISANNNVTTYKNTEIVHPEQVKNLMENGIVFICISLADVFIGSAGRIM